jgi:hypothetical protein
MFIEMVENSWHHGEKLCENQGFIERVDHKMD